MLGALARRGPMHGHQIRRDARIDGTEWSQVRPGSLYGALHRMAGDGLVEVVRTEQEGNLPVRTVYAITDDGRRELAVLRVEALREVAFEADPIDLALVTDAAELDEDALRGYILDRRHVLATRLVLVGHERERPAPGQTVGDDLVLDHARTRLEAEITWHDRILDRLGELTADRRHAPGAAPAVPALPARSASAVGTRGDAERNTLPRVRYGRLAEVVGHCDTALVERMPDPPPSR